MYHWGFALMAAVPMIVLALVLRRAIFGKDGNLWQTFVAVGLTWLIASLLGTLGVTEAAFGVGSAGTGWGDALVGYLKPTVVVAVILGSMAFIRTKA